MTRPSKVLGFLDLFGAWDASLAFVMVARGRVFVVGMTAGMLLEGLVTRAAGAGSTQGGETP